MSCHAAELSGSQTEPPRTFKDEVAWSKALQNELH